MASQDESESVKSLRKELFYWTDEGLQWNPSDFGGQTQLIVSSDLIWKPDVTFVNSPHAFRYDQQVREATVIVKSSGTVEWLPQIMFTTYCMTDLRDYPSDKQKCRLSIEPFYEYKYVDFKTFTHKNVSKYMRMKGVRYENQEWALIDSTVLSLTLIQLFIGSQIGFSGNKGIPLIVLSLTLIQLFIGSQIGFSGNKGIPLIVSKTGIHIVFIAIMTFCSVVINRLFAMKLS
ncbi:unnamed protein product, partial [Medioppia subpectinata]